MQEETIQPQEIQSLCFDVAKNVWGTKDVFVNVYMVRDEDTNNWVLIDTGLKSSASKIRKMAEHIFGKDSKPSAILLTHGHFDHTGSLKKLAEEWQVPVYCHYLELPYLSGKSSYPPPDASVDGGLMAKMAWMYPMKPINVESHLHILPPDGSVPFLSEWRYIYTPGHAPGHVSFFRSKDRVLIAGDAVVTTIQESVMSVMTQKKKLSGPPKYFTYDWDAAKHSLMAIADLHPEIIASGHGKPMSGAEMQAALHNLARHFDEMALPKHGRYLHDPAVIDASGVMYLPPKESKFPWGLALVTASILVGAAALFYLSSSKRRSAA
ncbi:MAG TPA: MBL fold metallo-hydrolase [Flavipsychrobacter sp.]|nr:MBL fold metallo-hydrolase [Flavipsychrobacter sp.]